MHAGDVELRFADVELDDNTHEVWRAGSPVTLTATEFNLLRLFLQNPKRVLSREQLLDLANARDREAFDRAIDVRITRLRRKIEPDPAHPSVIRTIRGAGYLFSPGGAEAG